MGLMRRTHHLLWLGIIFMLGPGAAARADVRLPGLISEHMVVQQDAPVRLWGWADEGERVTVAFRGETASAVTEHGRWRISLKPGKAGGPFSLTITGKNTISFTDVQVGEVWVSCGQSNMMMGLGSAEGGEAAIRESGNYPAIRLFTVPPQRLADEPLEELAGAWSAGGAAGVSGFSAVSYFFGRSLHQRLQVPVGLINAVAIMPAETWIDRATWAATPLVGEGRGGSKAASTFNGMIAPITPYAIRGAIYYQGEYNAGNPREFGRLLPALISSWRKHWGLGDFPFLFVQLPGFIDHRAEKSATLDMPEATLKATAKPGGDHAWCQMREEQVRVWQTVTNTAMAVTIDLGEAWDIHPKKKQPVGERLALAARAVAYGESLAYSGPIFDSLAVAGETVTLRFRHVGAGLRAQGETLAGFEMAGPDKRFVWADATIRGDTVVLRSAEVPDPATIRYAWAGFPNASLYNAAGLPASPFRATVPGKARQQDRFTVAFPNGGFEEPGETPANAAKWAAAKGAARSDAHAAEGKWAISLPVKGSAAQDRILAPGLFRYDWNSDITEPDTFRPGTLFGYSVSLAAPDGPVTAYLRLCADSTAGAYQYWGGVIEVKAASPQFTTFSVAGRMTDTFDLSGAAGGGMGILVANNGPGASLAVDGLSAVSFIRPMLGLSDHAPLDLGTAKPGAALVSAPRRITNSQPLTLPDRRTETGADANVPSVLYGIAHVKLALQWGVAHAWGATDHVGATLLGTDAARFEFVSDHLGATPQELKLIGADGQGGLAGGPEPESEELVVRFVGSDRPGRYTAFVRLITQAGNSGALSSGMAGEPLENLFYTDIAITAEVKP